MKLKTATVKPMKQSNNYDFRHQGQSLNPKTLLKIFPEAKTLTEDKLYKERRRHNKIENNIRDFLLIGKSKKDEWFVDEFAKVFLLPDLLRNEKRINRMKMFLNLLQDKPDKYLEFQRKMEKAREFPIIELAERELSLRRVGNKFVTSCIFHKEKTPSLFLYPDTSSFYCFGCQKSGDSITLTMELYNLGFKEAVDLLSRY